MVYSGSGRTSSTSSKNDYNKAYKMGVNTTKELCGICLETVIVHEKHRRKQQQEQQRASKNKTGADQSSSLFGNCPLPISDMPHSSQIPMCGCENPIMNHHLQRPQTPPQKSKQSQHDPCGNGYRDDPNSAAFLLAAEAIIEAAFPCTSPGTNMNMPATKDTGTHSSYSRTHTHTSSKAHHHQHHSNPRYDTRTDLNAHSSSSASHFQDNREEPDYPVTGTTDDGTASLTCRSATNLTDAATMTDIGTDIGVAMDIVVDQEKPNNSSIDVDAEIFMNIYSRRQQEHQHDEEGDPKEHPQGRKKPMAPTINTTNDDDTSHAQPKSQPGTPHPSHGIQSRNNIFRTNRRDHNGNIIKKSATGASNRSRRSLADDVVSVSSILAFSQEENQDPILEKISPHKLCTSHEEDEEEEEESAGVLSKKHVKELLQKAFKEIHRKTPSASSASTGRTRSHSHSRSNSEDLDLCPSSLPPLKFDSKRTIWREPTGPSASGSNDLIDEDVTFVFDDGPHPATPSNHKNTIVESHSNKSKSSKCSKSSKGSKGSKLSLFHDQVVNIVTMQEQQAKRGHKNAANNLIDGVEEEEEEDDMTGPRPHLDEEDYDFDLGDGIRVMPVTTAKSHMSMSMSAHNHHLHNCDNSTITGSCNSSSHHHQDHQQILLSYHPPSPMGTGHVGVPPAIQNRIYSQKQHKNKLPPATCPPPPPTTPTNKALQKKRERNELFVVKEQLQYTMSKLESTQYELSVMKGIKNLYQRELETKAMECKLAEWRLHHKPLVIDVTSTGTSSNLNTPVESNAGMTNEKAQCFTDHIAAVASSSTPTATESALLQPSSPTNHNHFFDSSSGSSAAPTKTSRRRQALVVLATLTIIAGVSAIVAFQYFPDSAYLRRLPQKEVFDSLIAVATIEMLKAKVLLNWMLVEASIIGRELVGQASTIGRELAGQASTIGRELAGQASTIGRDIAGQASTIGRELAEQVSTIGRELAEQVSTIGRDIAGQASITITNAYGYMFLIGVDFLRRAAKIVEQGQLATTPFIDSMKAESEAVRGRLTSFDARESFDYFTMNLTRLLEVIQLWWKAIVREFTAVDAAKLQDLSSHKVEQFQEFPSDSGDYATYTI